MANPPVVNKTNLIWIDLEMTGLIPEQDVIIEIATIVTDSDLNILAEGPNLAIHQSDESSLLRVQRNSVPQRVYVCMV